MVPPPPPLPPPPPPPPPPVTNDSGNFGNKGNDSNGDVSIVRTSLDQACRRLEQARCQHAELEGLLYLGSHFITLSSSSSVVRSSGSGNAEGDGVAEAAEEEHVPLPVQEVVDEIMVQSSTSTGNPPLSKAPSAKESFPPPGQWGQAAYTSVLSKSLQRASSLASEIVQSQTLEQQQQKQESSGALSSAENSTEITESSSLSKCRQMAKRVAPEAWLSYFDERVKELKTYHARFDDSNTIAIATMDEMNSEQDDKMRQSYLIRAQKRARMVSQGFDLASVARPWWSPTVMETRFQPNELLGKYLDLEEPQWIETIHQLLIAQQDTQGSKSAPQVAPLTYADFLQLLLQKGLDQFVSSEQIKLRHRKIYARFLLQLQDYLVGYLERTVPLLDVTKEIIEPAQKTFTKEWSETGGFAPGWEAKPAEAAWVLGTTSSSNVADPNENKTDSIQTIDLSLYETAEALVEAVDGDRLKVELGRLGLKCGGTVMDRAKRLMITKDYKDRSEWPRKILAKQTALAQSTTTVQTGAGTNVETQTHGTKHEKRVDLVQREAVVTALLNQVKPTLEATLRRMERRQGQTLQERETEMEEELYHGQRLLPGKKKATGSDNDKDEQDDEDEDDDDTPIYNPKNVPLDWDGKPIPYWLFKLHGLNHYYECEICGGETYRGRRNFELHFADSKHALGMKSLGIPNTKHFHGITKIDDAKALWKTLQSTLATSQFDAATQEEYEDSHGNVLSRTTYEDLARQGLL